MGRFSRINLSLLRPSQDYLNQEGVNLYLKYIRKGKTLAPIPVAVVDDSVVMLDCHHQCAAQSHITDKVDIWLADGPRDKIPSEYFAPQLRLRLTGINESIGRRYHTVFSYDPGVQTIYDLVRGIR